MNTDEINNPSWKQQPAAAELIEELLERFRQSPEIKIFEQRLRDETGTRLVDWIDSVFVSSDHDLLRRLEEVGFQCDGEDPSVWQHAGGDFPQVCCDRRFFQNDTIAEIAAIKVDCVDDFCRIHAVDSSNCRGKQGSQLRTAQIKSDNGPGLAVVERHGWHSFDWPNVSDEHITQASEHRRALRERLRDGEDESPGFRSASDLIDSASLDLGIDWTCDLFFSAEREYWMSRNRAARVQYERQQRLGLGWGNHDHHTYRSSRANFQNLIAFLERLGFHCRERFYAGKEAGWGAQVLEQPRAGIVVFADVDLSPAEISDDFAHQLLSPRRDLGTIGMWCALHGESFLQAGMHHLECQFDFDLARRQLLGAGIETMEPFTDFSFLRQAFTAGETWPVAPERIAEALSCGAINMEQAESFRKVGALGSHLEILERNQGYKGFNQTGVSDIILRTDPRKT